MHKTHLISYVVCGKVGCSENVYSDPSLFAADAFQDNPRKVKIRKIATKYLFCYLRIIQTFLNPPHTDIKNQPTYN